MDTLVECIECNKQLSSAASQCPHCKTYEPKGKTCAACMQPIGSKDLVLSEMNYSFHRSCLDTVRQVDFICPLCKNNVTHSCSNCPNCGQPLSTVHCLYCQELVNLNDSERIQFTSSTYQTMRIGEWGEHIYEYQPCNCPTHLYCQTKRDEANQVEMDQLQEKQRKQKAIVEQERREKEEAQRQEQTIREQRVRDGSCVACGKPLGFFDKLLRVMAHSQCNGQ